MKGNNMREKFTINAVYEGDLKKFMKSIDMWKDYKRGNLKCLCGNTITNENLTAFVSHNKKPQAICSLFCKDLLTK